MYIESYANLDFDAPPLEMYASLYMLSTRTNKDFDIVAFRALHGVPGVFSATTLLGWTFWILLSWIDRYLRNANTELKCSALVGGQILG